MLRFLGYERVPMPNLEGGKRIETNKVKGFEGYTKSLSHCDDPVLDTC